MRLRRMGAAGALAALMVVGAGVPAAASQRAHGPSAACRDVAADFVKTWHTWIATFLSSVVSPLSTAASDGVQAVATATNATISTLTTKVQHIDALEKSLLNSGLALEKRGLAAVKKCDGIK